MDIPESQKQVHEPKYLTWLKNTRISRRTLWLINLGYLISYVLLIGIFFLFGVGVISVFVVVISLFILTVLSPVLRILRMNDISPEQRIEYMKQGSLGSLRNYLMLGWAPSRPAPQSSFNESMEMVQNADGTFNLKKYSQLLSHNRTFKISMFYLLVLAILSFIGGLYLFWNGYEQHQELSNTGVTTVAYYEDTRYERGGNTYEYYFYDSSGGLHTTSTQVPEPSQIRVTYSPTNPDNNSTENAPAWFIGPLFFICLGIMFAIGALACFQVMRQKF